MTSSPMTAPAEIVQLVELFKSNCDQYHSPAFSEAAVRHQFIDPFFASLGWDVNNMQGYAEQYKEVVHEDKVKVSGATKAPDYSFRIGKERKFFVEAKKPAVDIQTEIEPGVPAPPLCVERQAAAFDPHRLRGAVRLRLPLQAGLRPTRPPRAASCC